MLTFTQNQLTGLPAFARSVLQSIESMLMHGQRPALVPVSATNRIRPVSSVSCDRGYVAIAGTIAKAAAPMHADPVTEGWRSPAFGKTKTGNTGHSQPSRFAT